MTSPATESGKPTVLITGIGGFIGRAMTQRLAGAGYRVVGTDLGERPLVDGMSAYATLDAASPEVAPVLSAFGPLDAIIHAGGISGFMVARDDPQRIFDVNAAGSARLLEFARRNGVRRVVLCSTIMVYGPSPLDREPLAESEYPVPGTLYGASKLAIEGLATGYAGQYGLDVVALRFSHVYGRGRTTECFLRDMVLAALDGERCKVGQPGGSVRQYVHIEDICASIIAALAPRPMTDRIFNISAGEIHTLREVRDAVREVVGPLDVDFDEANDVAAYRIPQLSIARAREQLGYVPELRLRQGIARFAESLRAEQYSLASSPPGRTIP